MNKAQKCAWLNLVGFVLCITSIAYVIITLFAYGGPHEFILGMWPPVIAFPIIMVISVIWLRRKQSPKEVDSDERDKLIQSRALLVAFVSVWILLFAASIIPWLVLGEDGSIPVWVLAIINLCVFFVVMLIFQIAVLVQYGWRGKDGE